MEFRTMKPGVKEVLADELENAAKDARIMD